MAQTAPNEDVNNVDNAKDKLNETVSRRSLFTGGLAAAAATMMQVEATARSAPAASPPTQVDDAIWRLMNRATHGYTYSEYVNATNLGYAAYLDQQLNYQMLPSPAIPQMFPSMAKTAKELSDVSESADVRSATLARAILSQQRLFERVVEVWEDHFNRNSQEDGQIRYLIGVSNEKVIRRFAMGNFKRLLRETARDPAMLRYLDNAVSRCFPNDPSADPNENYAREFLELHTMGVGSSYTETDIKQFARVLAGWSTQGDRQASDFGVFWFKGPPNTSSPNFTCPNSKTVLGQTFHVPADPEQEGVLAIRHIANHPDTRDYISRKLIQRLLTDEDPDPAIVSAVSAEYPSIRRMVKAALAEANLELACPDVAPKYKRPLHFVTSLMRAIGAGVLLPNGYRALLGQLDMLGQRLHTYGPPTGYPDSVFDWGQAQKLRWDFAINLMRQQLVDVAVTPSSSFGQVGGYVQSNAGQLVNLMLCAGNMTSTEVNVIQGLANSYSSSPTEDELGDLIALGAIGPTFNQI